MTDARQAVEQKQLQLGPSPAGLLSCFCPVSLCLEGPACCSAMAAAPASQKPLWHWLTGGGRSWFTVSWEVLWLQASFSISSLRPQLNKALEWSLLSCCLQLTAPLPVWQKMSLWPWWLLPEKVSTVSSGLGCFDILYSWWILETLMKNHYSGGRIFFSFFRSFTSGVQKYVCMMERGFFFPTAKTNVTF